MKHKKLIFILAAMLAFSVAAVGAYLIATDEINNTFVINDRAFEDNAEFSIKEHEAQDSDKDGVYELTQNEVVSNTYNVYPGVDIPKDPFVEISGLHYDAYLFIEVVGESTEQFKWAVNDNWLMTDLEGKKGGTVYVYKGNTNDAVVLTQQDNSSFSEYILAEVTGSENGGIEIGNDYDTEDTSLTFYGYLIVDKSYQNYIEAYNDNL